MEPLALTALAALAFAFFLRRPGAFFPALVSEGSVRAPAPRMPGDEDEQLPETDRAPRQWLPWAVAAVAVVRVALLLTLRA
ncbi:MAG TPA: hypothetical protein VFL36_06775 [Myxococcales bacterium]|nr:hypothetical protein [Myxococcales bacterium]